MRRAGLSDEHRRELAKTAKARRRAQARVANLDAQLAVLVAAALADGASFRDLALVTGLGVSSIHLIAARGGYEPTPRPRKNTPVAA